MDGKARWVDNVVIERWFRSLKTERIYVNEYTTPKALRAGIQEYIYEYNTARPHQTYNYISHASLSSSTDCSLIEEKRRFKWKYLVH